ncbi:permease [Geoalkalibacter halelectricus]|uniref:Permease n=1 Tax=Geoalkalibacter halelectricus TaxID=2847045 RepID=A0ABY5ZI61_9BACT|nr:permease [Geoalkalibacter halelectricus]MDO3379028.1 permease [Geoalkalibacter halelectricus]UWZ78842.1 permease [Geoalkalibacter halelectricus]
MPETVLQQMWLVIYDEVTRMWWFFLLACLLVGIIKGYKLDLHIRNLVNRAGAWGIFLAVLVGMVSPLCACGILPIAISLAMMGTPLPPLLALLATSPTMGPDALLLTYRGLGPEWAVLKVVGSGFLGLAAGFVAQALVRQGYLAGDLLKLKPVYREDGTLAPAAEIGRAHGIAVKSMSITPRHSRLRFILDRTLDAALFTGKYLLLAILLKALIVALVPISWILVLVGQPNFLSLINAALIGLPLPTNQIPIIPILAGLLDRGIDQGAALTLFMAGPVTSLPALIALWGMFHGRVVAVFLALGLGGSVFLGMLYQVFF